MLQRGQHKLEGRRRQERLEAEAQERRLHEQERAVREAVALVAGDDFATLAGWLRVRLYLTGAEPYTREAVVSWEIPGFVPVRGLFQEDWGSKQWRQCDWTHDRVNGTRWSGLDSRDRWACCPTVNRQGWAYAADLDEALALARQVYLDAAKAADGPVEILHRGQSVSLNGEGI